MWMVHMKTVVSFLITEHLLIEQVQDTFSATFSSLSWYSYCYCPLFQLTVATWLREGYFMSLIPSVLQHDSSVVLNKHTETHAHMALHPLTSLANLCMLLMCAEWVVRCSACFILHPME